MVGRPGGTPGHAILDQSTLPGLARRVLVVMVLQAATLTGCWAANYEPSQLVPPKPLREFRGAWVATVGNLDWPSRPGLTTAQQRAELMALLERAAQLKLNVVIFQVRPACDALYASKLEPWSESITGTMGKAPLPFYDPLAFAIEEAHRRGLELHAWFNPFRAGHPAAHSPLAPTHVSRTHPHWVRLYGRQLWLDPGEKEVQDYSLAVVMDVVRRYDVDGVHFDDYFYPYPEKNGAGRDLDFPDDSTWKRFGVGSRLSLDEWRRDNVNVFIHRTYESIKAAKPWVRFGISPFGIWRPGYPPKVKGFDPYAKLYADSRKWLANGWVDYFAPQLYWAIDSPDQSFSALLSWWAEQNPKGRHLLAGLDSSKAGGKWQPQEIVSQILLSRRQTGMSGHVHWEMMSLMTNRSLVHGLEKDAYEQVALVPASPWLGSAPTPMPTLAVRSGQTDRRLRATWSPGGAERPWLWVLQYRQGSEWQTEVLPAAQGERAWSRPLPVVVAVTAIDRNGKASPAAVMQAQR